MSEPRIVSPWGRILVGLAVYLALSACASAVFLVVSGAAARMEGLLGGTEEGVEQSLQVLRDVRVFTSLLGVQALVGILTVWGMAVLIDRRPLASLGFAFSRESRTGSLAWGLMLGGVLASVVLLTITAAGGRHIRPHFFADSSWVWGIGTAVAVLLAAFMEEWLVRGYVYVNARERLRAGRTIFITAFLFTALHFRNPGNGFLAWTNLFLVGIVLGQLREITRGLRVPVGLHAGWNLTLGVLFGAEVSGVALPSAFRVYFDEVPPILSGGTFGPEASIVATILFGGVAAWLAYRLVRSEEHELG